MSHKNNNFHFYIHLYDYLTFNNFIFYTFQNVYCSYLDGKIFVKASIQLWVQFLACLYI